jgi:hypothetical protein
MFQCVYVKTFNVRKAQTSIVMCLLIVFEFQERCLVCLSPFSSKVVSLPVTFEACTFNIKTIVQPLLANPLLCIFCFFHSGLHSA